MNISRTNNIHVDTCLKKCLPDFSHINHYWDESRQIVIAKILPGEFYMTPDNIAIATTLGSCISACIWDEELGIGGMNHFMLPITNKKAHEVDWGKRGFSADATRYGNFAMEHLINHILRAGGRKHLLKAKVFGGGKVLKGVTDVGQRNIEFVLDYLKLENIEVQSSDLGNIYPRKVLFYPHSGKAFVKILNSLHNNTIVNREYDYCNRIKKSNIAGDIELF